jgi:hypothetical protein
MAKLYGKLYAPPFKEYLEDRFASLQARVDANTSDEGPGASAALLLTQELGWEGEAGIRKLYRFRYGRKSGSRFGRKCEYPTVTFPREVVEEALHSAGVDLHGLYGDYVERMAGRRGRPVDVLEHLEGFLDFFDDPVLSLVPREEWCARCEDTVFVDAEGECQWCAGERELRWQLDVRGRQRDRDRERSAKRRALKAAA